MFQIGDMIMVSNGETDADHYGFIVGFAKRFDHLSAEMEYKIDWFDGVISYEFESDIIKVS